MFLQANAATQYVMNVVSQIPAPSATKATHLILMESVWHAAFRIVLAVVSQLHAIYALLAMHLDSVRNAAQSVFLVVRQIPAPPAKMATELLMKSV